MAKHLLEHFKRILILIFFVQLIHPIKCNYSLYSWVYDSLNNRLSMKLIEQRYKLGHILAYYLLFKGLYYTFLDNFHTLDLPMSDLNFLFHNFQKQVCHNTFKRPN